MIGLKKPVPLFHPIRSKTRFPALCVSYVYSLWALIGSRYCVCLCSPQTRSYPSLARSLPVVRFLCVGKERKRLLHGLSLSSLAISFLFCSSLSICCCPIFADYSFLVCCCKSGDVREKFFKVRENSGDFILSQGKLTFWIKIKENWTPFKAGNNFWGHCDLNDVFT